MAQQEAEDLTQDYSAQVVAAVAPPTVLPILEAWQANDTVLWAQKLCPQALVMEAHTSNKGMDLLVALHRVALELQEQRQAMVALAAAEQGMVMVVLAALAPSLEAAVVAAAARQDQEHLEQVEQAVQAALGYG